jgi:hypothetical protein
MAGQKKPTRCGKTQPPPTPVVSSHSNPRFGFGGARPCVKRRHSAMGGKRPGHPGQAARERLRRGKKTMHCVVWRRLGATPEPRAVYPTKRRESPCHQEALAVEFAPRGRGSDGGGGRVRGKSSCCMEELQLAGRAGGRGRRGNAATHAGRGRRDAPGGRHAGKVLAPAAEPPAPPSAAARLEPVPGPCRRSRRAIDR